MRACRRVAPPVRVTRPSLPCRRLPAPLDRARSLPRAEPARALGAAHLRGLALRGPLLRLPPTRAVLVEELGDGLLHPQAQLLVRLALLREQRLAVPDPDRRAARAGPGAALGHRLVGADDRDRHDRHVHVERESGRAVAEALEPAVLRTGALGEHDDVPALADQLL